MRILVTGGCGYVGSVLVPKLLAAGHKVDVWDTMWFGRNLPESDALRVEKIDIRDDHVAKPSSYDYHAVIHLAGIANDPCGDLDARLTWEVNVLATMRLADAAARAGVRRFVFASSASVYGLKDNAAVEEHEPLAPVSDYNKTKMVAERVLRSYEDRMSIVMLRPATVCGVSPRMRLDTMVNMLTVQALETRRITAHCGAHGENLMRPNVHIEDVTDAYVFAIDDWHFTGPYNVGFENISAGDTARMIAGVVEAEVEFTKVADKRSYAVSSRRFLELGFTPRRSVADAISEIAAARRAGKIETGPITMNLTWMQLNGWAS